MPENGEVGIRTRIWITKIDHSGEWPREVEEVCIEAGRVVLVKDLRKEPETAERKKE